MRALAWLFLLIWLPNGASGQEEEEPNEPTLGPRASFDLSGQSADTMPVEAGARLRAQPDFRSPEVTSMPEALELPVIERRGSWARVQYGHQRGWVLVRDPAGTSPQGLAARRLEVLPSAEELAELGRHLEGGGREATLGPYRLLTDVAPSSRLEALDRLASQLSQAYEQRFGLALPAGSGEVVALFAEEADYRVYAEGSPELVGLEAAGHAGNGLAALALESLPADDAPGVLIHELTHLMNRRALGPGEDLPPWLDEGLAEDLAYSAVTGAGKLRLGSLAGRLNTDNEVGDSPGRLGARIAVTVSGPRVQLARLAGVFGTADCPSLAALVDLPWSEFKDPARRPLLYALSAFWVRYLLDGEGGRRAGPFRAFLKSVAGGGPSGPAALSAALGASIPELETGFTVWLRVQTGSDRPLRR